MEKEKVDNFKRGYELLEQGDLEQAEKFWSDLFVATGDHKALHQVGFVRRSAGEITEALNIFINEQGFIPKDDKISQGINLYEIAYCHMLLNDQKAALAAFQKYDQLGIEDDEMVERDTFLRFKVTSDDAIGKS